MVTGRVNVGGGGGRLNIYTQMSEPSKKEGIWMKTDRPYKKVVVDESTFTGGQWASDGADIPYLLSTRAFAIPIGNDEIYVMGGDANNRNVTRYDISNNSYTALPLLGMDQNNFGGSYLVSHGTDIYILGSNGYSENNRRTVCYDTTTGQHVRLSDAPTSTDSCSAAVVGNFIYIFAGQRTYRYDITDDVYTQMSNPPTNAVDTIALPYGKYVYVLGGNVSSTRRAMHRYDTEADEWERLSDMPYNIYDGGGIRRGSAVIVGSEIYIVGGPPTISTYYMYKYDITTDTYSQLDDAPTQISGGGMTFTSGRIFIFGSAISEYRTSLRIYAIDSKSYGEYHVILLRTNEFNGTYHTELLSPAVPLGGDEFTRITTNFDDVFLYYGDRLHSLESYYGNGTEWIKFKEEM